MHNIIKTQIIAIKYIYKVCYRAFYFLLTLKITMIHDVHISLIYRNDIQQVDPLDQGPAVEDTAVEDYNLRYCIVDYKIIFYSLE